MREEKETNLNEVYDIDYSYKAADNFYNKFIVVEIVWGFKYVIKTEDKRLFDDVIEWLNKNHRLKYNKNTREVFIYDRWYSPETEFSGEIEPIIRAGKVVVFTDGCYSDYNIEGIYVAVKDFNYMEQAKKCYFEEAEKDYKKKPEEKIEYMNCDAETFASFLIREGFIIMCEQQEIHTGDYGEMFESKKWKEEFLKSKGVE